MAETMANGYSSESTQQELSNEYQHDRVEMVLKNPCILVLRTKVALALDGLSINRLISSGILFMIMPTTLLQIFCKIILNYKVIIKSIIDPDDNFKRINGSI